MRTAWQALAARPFGFLMTSWPWRSLAYLLSGVLVGAATAASLTLLVIGGMMLAVVVVGLVLLLCVALSGLVIARFERWRLRLVDRDPVGNPHRRPASAGWRSWLGTRLREPQTWREFGYVLVSLFGLWWIDLGVLIFSFGVPMIVTVIMVTEPPPVLLGVVLVILMLPVSVLAMAYPVTVWAGARAAMARNLLGPDGAELGQRLGEVARSRARLVDAYEVERRRIERDLHDGAQQRLVALTMTLGLAELDLPPGSPSASAIRAAQDQARLALAELRELIRGVHPQVLTDRGLAAAVRDVAGRSATPVTVDIDLPRRLPAPVETTAYFVIAEALANVAKHSRAARASVWARLAEVDPRLCLRIVDDGRGGADPGLGTGLAGLLDRLAVVDGVLTITSPSGGPTVLTVEIPCPD